MALCGISHLLKQKDFKKRLSGSLYTYWIFGDTRKLLSLVTCDNDIVIIFKNVYLLDIYAKYLQKKTSSLDH